MCTNLQSVLAQCSSNLESLLQQDNNVQVSTNVYSLFTYLHLYQLSPVCLRGKAAHPFVLQGLQSTFKIFYNVIQSYVEIVDLC